MKVVDAFNFYKENNYIKMKIGYSNNIWSKNYLAYKEEVEENECYDQTIFKKISFITTSKWR